MEEVTHVELLAVKLDNYSIYVFKDISKNTYIMCTKLPNWIMPNIEIGERGFLKFQKVIAGEKYFNPETGKKSVYNYTNIYMLNFMKEQDIQQSNINL